MPTILRRKRSTLRSMPPSPNEERSTLRNMPPYHSERYTPRIPTTLRGTHLGYTTVGRHIHLGYTTVGRHIHHCYTPWGIHPREAYTPLLHTWGMGGSREPFNTVSHWGMRGSREPFNTISEVWEALGNLLTPVSLFGRLSGASFYLFLLVMRLSEPFWQLFPVMRLSGASFAPFVGGFPSEEGFREPSRHPLHCWPAL